MKQKIEIESKTDINDLHKELLEMILEKVAKDIDPENGYLKKGFAKCMLVNHGFFSAASAVQQKLLSELQEKMNKNPENYTQICPISDFTGDNQWVEIKTPKL